MGYSFVTKNTEKEILARNHRQRLRTCKEQHVQICLGGIRNLTLKGVMHREKRRSAQDCTPYKRGSWGTKGYTPNALLGIVFKSSRSSWRFVLCLEKRHCLWAEVFPGMMQQLAL